MWVRLSTLFGYALLAGTGIGILYPAFFDERVGLTHIIVSLFEPELTQSFAMRWLLVLVFIGSLYVVVAGIYHRNKPVTVLHSTIKVIFSGENWNRTDVEGTYILRANHSNVTSYRSTHTPDFGSIPLASISADIFCESCNLTSAIELAMTDGRGIEILQLFSKPLPTSWFMPLIPMLFIRREYDDLPHFLRRRLVKRRLKLSYNHEHSVELPTMRFFAPNYPHMSMFITLEFPANAMPVLFTARRSKNNALTEIPVEVSGGVHHVRIDKLYRSEVVRFSWRQRQPESATGANSHPSA